MAVVMYKDNNLKILMEIFDGFDKLQTQKKRPN